MANPFSSPAPVSPIGRLFSVVALVEALTWAGLLLGMFLKYGTGTTEVLVWWFGRLHGVAFLVYVAVAVWTASQLRWSLWHTVLAILAAIPPLVTLPLEIVYRKRGLLAPAAVTTARPNRRPGRL
ncbi:integral membrane protein [Lampropedia hyalina DSM 16112]|jgi:integral membrane protein|uniref:Integral membrane protein n=1 Tax=Lampropedia hyalina DSM 16112 TaxID=1122156 RepID=A0A1M4XVJ2_9BURK|nr:DUF3817 domain-containing protein [Lampropedia hyalina]SHE97438.1 integral membrane protein [Lampropedia hyalina DSM 16112]